MHSIYFEDDDTLQIRLLREGQDKPIVREVSQGWYTIISYAADGTIVGSGYFKTANKAIAFIDAMLNGN